MSNSLRRLTTTEIDNAKGYTWHALIVPPQREFVVQRILDRRGLVTFVPAEWRWRKISRYRKGKTRVDRPAYPKYVFLGVPAGCGIPWMTLIDIHLVRGFMGRASDGMPQVFSSTDIAQIMSAAMTPLFSEPDWNAYMETGHEFNPGDIASVGDGPLEGLEIMVDRIEGPNAVCVMEFLGKTGEQSIPLTHLRAA